MRSCRQAWGRSSTYSPGRNRCTCCPNATDLRQTIGLVPKDTIHPLLTQVGIRIRKLREARDLSQAELARRAGVDRAALNAIEAGHRNLSVIYLAKIARGLRVTPGSLLDD